MLRNGAAEMQSIKNQCVILKTPRKTKPHFATLFSLKKENKLLTLRCTYILERFYSIVH